MGVKVHLEYRKQNIEYRSKAGKRVHNRCFLFSILNSMFYIPFATLKSISIIIAYMSSEEEFHDAVYNVKIVYRLCLTQRCVWNHFCLVMTHWPCSRRT
jgi:hypothetical protein